MPRLSQQIGGVEREQHVPSERTGQNSQVSCICVAATPSWAVLCLASLVNYWGLPDSTYPPETGQPPKCGPTAHSHFTWIAI